MRNWELLKPQEFIPMAFEAVKIAGSAVGKVALEPFRGGWADIGRTRIPPPKPANVIISEDPHERDAEL